MANYYIRLGEFECGACPFARVITYRLDPLVWAAARGITLGDGDRIGVSPFRVSEACPWPVSGISVRKRTNPGGADVIFLAMTPQNSNGVAFPLQEAPFFQRGGEDLTAGGTWSGNSNNNQTLLGEGTAEWVTFFITYAAGSIASGEACRLFITFYGQPAEASRG